MELCTTNPSLLDIAIFLGQCLVAGGMTFVFYALGGFISRRVSLKRLEMMAEKPSGSWFEFWALFLSVLATVAVGLGATFYLRQVLHLSPNIATTVGMAACAGLVGLCLGLSFELRDRVDYVRTDQRGLLEW